MAKRTRQSSVSIGNDILLSIIRDARIAAGLSQREVGKRLGFHPTVFNKIENGARVLDVVEFVALARAIGLDPIGSLGDFLVTEQKQRLDSIEEPK